MAHNHYIVDDDRSFVIDPQTRKIANVSGKVISLIQNDHKSERFVFTMPRIIEGHDMLSTDFIKIHFINAGIGTSASVRATRVGVYTVTDISETEDENIVQFSWLVEQDSTSLAGTISFQIKFECYESDDPSKLAYLWSTDTFKDVKVRSSIDNTGSIFDGADAPTDADANKLFYVDDDLQIRYLTLGPGLAIKDGALVATI